MKTRNYEIFDPWTRAERRFKNSIDRIKVLFFYPFLKLIIKAGIMPNTVSYFSAVLGVISSVVIFYNLKFSAIFLAASIALDGIDGSLARFSKRYDAKGAITDCLSDQIVITSTTIGFVGAKLLNPMIAVYYSTVYPIVIMFIIIRKKMNIPNFYSLRPRFIVYGAFFVFVLFKINFLNEIMIFSSVFLTYSLVNNFIKIHEVIKNV